MLNLLSDPSVWQEFVEYKRDGGHLNREDMERLEQFAKQGEYLSVAEGIRNGESFAPPRKSAISKKSSSKKRIVSSGANRSSAL